MVNVNKSDRFKAITDIMASVYRSKNADYGDSFGESFKDFGMLSSVIRIGDKYRRLKSLVMTGEQHVKDESLRDTLLDLANYAIMTIIEMDMCDNNVVQ